MSDRSIHSAAALLVPLSMVVMLLLSGIPYNPELPKETEISHTGGMIQDVIMVKDIDSGTGSGNPKNFVVMGNTLYFQANDGTNGLELWKSDGTEAGTEMVMDINSGGGDSDPADLTVMSNTLYFTADDGNSGRELWTSDGTTSGTMKVYDIWNGGSGGTPAHLTVMGNSLYFQAKRGSSGVELWTSDGTSSGTMIVKDINSGSGDSDPADLTVMNNTLYFTANDSINGQELWVSDGTSSGTMMVKDIYPAIAGSTPAELTVMGNTLYFQANGYSAAAGGSGVELWKSDGTSSGTVMVKDINSGSADSSPTELTVVGSTLFFSARDSVGRELWKSNGTTSGTVMVKNIWTGSSGPGDGDPKEMISMGNILYFQAASYDIDTDGYYDGVELWKSDGTTSGTVRVKDINSNTNGSSSPEELTVIGSTFYFQANRGSPYGSELWKSDGTSSGTMMVKDINNGSLSSSPTELTVMGNTLYFRATDNADGAELWKMFEFPEDAATATVEAGIHQFGSQVAVITNLTGVTPGWDYTIDWSFEYGSNGTEIFRYTQPPSYFIDTTTFNTSWSFFNTNTLVAGVDLCLEVSVYNGTTIGANALGSHSMCIQLPTWTNFMKNSGSGVGGSIGNSIAFDSNDNAHISYYEDSAASHWLKYTGYAGNSWTNTIVDSSVDEVGLYSSIAVDSNDDLHISYYDATNGDLKYATYDGFSWTTSTVDSTGDVGKYTSIAVDSNGNLHISYYNKNTYDLKYATYSGSSWTVSTIDSVGVVGQYTSIAVDSNNNLHISYQDVSNGDLKYATYDVTGQWTVSTVDSTGIVGKYTSIAVDSGASVHISYYDETNMDLKYATIGSGDASWTISTIDSTGDVGKYSSIVVDSNDDVRISYYDATNQDLKYAGSGSAGQGFLLIIDSEGDVGRYSSLALDSDDNPQIAYYESTPNAEGLKFACFGCTVTNVTSGPTLNMDASYQSNNWIYLSPFTLSGISTTENYNVDMILTYESNGTIIDNQWENFSCGCSSYTPQTGLNWNLGSMYNGNEILDNTAYVLWANVYNSGGTIITQSNTLIVTIPPSANEPSVSVNLEYKTQTEKLEAVYSLSNLDDSEDYILEITLFFQLNSSSIVSDSITVDCNCNSESGSATWEEGTVYAPYIITDDTAYCIGVILKNSAGTVLDQVVSCGNYPQTDDGLSWLISTIPDTSSNYGQYVDMALDSQENPHFCYYDNDNSDLKYAMFDGSSWIFTHVDGYANDQTTGAIDADIGKYCSIAFDSNNMPRISYYDATNGNLRFAALGAGDVWMAEIVDSSGDVGTDTSLVMSSNNIPHISYYGENESGLAFLFYANKSDGNWNVYNLNIAGNSQAAGSPVGTQTSITLYNNLPAISYYNALNSDLKIAIYGDNWNFYTVDSDGLVGSFSSIAVNNQGFPHISYYDETNGALKYATFDGLGNWVNNTLDDEGDTGLYTSLAFNDDGFVSISYFDSSNGSLKYIVLEPTQWDKYTIDTVNRVGEYSSLAIDSTGEIYVAYYDNTAAVLKLACNTCNFTDSGGSGGDGSGVTWSNSTVDSGGSVGQYTSIAVDSNDNLHISYYDGSFALEYATYDGSSWTTSTVDSVGSVGSHTSIAVDSNDNLHISYFDATGNDLKYATYDGSSWTISTIDSAVEGWNKYTSIAIDSNDNIHISYYNNANDDLKYATYDGSSWTVSTVDSTGDVGAYTSIAVDSNDDLHISYYDATNEDLKYAFYDGNSWTTSTVDSAGNVGLYTSIAVDSNDNLHISYYDSTNLDLKYTTYDGSSWTTSPVDSAEDVGKYASIGVDSNDNLHISYYDIGNGDLKYATYDGSSWTVSTVDTGYWVGRYTSIAVDSNDDLHISYYGLDALKYATAVTSGGSDGDNDGIVDSMDNCPDDENYGQDNHDGDNAGDICDDDDDNDGIDDGDDRCYQGMTEWWSWDENPVIDFDHDGCRDSDEDDDDDDDGVLDTSDTCLETRLGAVVDTEGCESSFPDDDGDGVSNSYDDCPNTTVGTAVDDFDGCPEGDDGSEVTWSNLVIDSEGDVGKWSSIAVDSNDNLHISYFDNTNGDLKYATYDGSSWTVSTVDMGDVGLYSSIAIDSNNNIHISYYDSTNSALKYATYDGSSWTISTVDNLGTLGTHTSIAVDSSDNLHISYRNDTGVALKYATYDGNSWTVSTVDSTGNVGKYSSIAADSNGNLHISYFDSTNTALKYATYDGSSWTVSTVDSVGIVGYDTSIAIDSNDNLHISYLDLANVDLKYATYDGGSWTVSTVDSVGDGLVHSSIAVDSNDDIHISYHAAVTNWILKYATYDGSSWTTSTIDNNIGNVDQYSSIAVDSNDNLHISYRDTTNDDLKYATTSSGGSGTGVDSDGDGVPDADDDCPNNAANPPTDGDYDGDGCPDSMDTDKDDDDVFNVNDNCPNSPLGWSTLDEDPIVDWDHDGCLDDIEDEDVDGDGVLNGVDECAFTLIGARVDDVGCISSEDEVVDDIESDEEPEGEWYSRIPIIGSQIQPIVDAVKTKYGKAISASIFVLTALGYAYRVVMVRSEMKMKKRMNKFEKRIDNADSDKELRRIEKDVEVAEEKNLLPLGGYGDLMSMIENREEELGIDEGSESEQMMSMAAGMQSEMAESMQAMRETQEDIASMAEGMLDMQSQQTGPSRPGMAASPRPMQTSSGMSRPSYHPKDMDEDGTVSQEDLQKFNALSKAEQRARLSGAADDDGGLTSEIVRFSKIPRSSKARCYCGSNKQFGKCHLGKEKCPCGSGKKFLKCCAKKRNFR